MHLLVKIMRGLLGGITMLFNNQTKKITLDVIIWIGE